MSNDNLHCYAFKFEERFMCYMCGLTWSEGEGKPACRLSPDAHFYDGPVDLVYVRRLRAAMLPIMCAEKWPRKAIEATFMSGAKTKVPVLQRTELSDEEALMTINDLMIRYPFKGAMTGAKEETASKSVAGKGAGEAGGTQSVASV